jgi:two-component system, OmpR family, response regulator
MAEPLGILVIDDNVNLARGFAMALESAGYRAFVAHTADEGLWMARQEHPNAIVLDLRMPYINGIGYLYRLREIPGLSETPVMVVTAADVDEETRRELADLRATIRFKPIGLSELITEIQTLLRDSGPAEPSSL